VQRPTGKVKKDSVTSRTNLTEIVWPCLSRLSGLLKNEALHLISPQVQLEFLPKLKGPLQRVVQRREKPQRRKWANLVRTGEEVQKPVDPSATTEAIAKNVQDLVLVTDGIHLLLDVNGKGRKEKKKERTTDGSAPRENVMMMMTQGDGEMMAEGTKE
jgi:hypothetical protein